LSQAESAINGTVHNLQPWFVDLVSEVGLDVALRLTEDATRQYTGNYFYEELQGLADATGLTVGPKLAFPCFFIVVVILVILVIVTFHLRSCNV
jgi:hypothetical protein